MDSNRNQDEIFLAPETGIWLTFAARAVPGRGFDDAPLSAASLSRLATWAGTAPASPEVRSALAIPFARARAALEALFRG